MNIFGHNFRLAIWGESHGPQIGISIDGVPAGIPLSAEDFEADLARRRSGARGTTPRREPDIPQIVSGLYNGMTTGAPLTIEFANTDTHSQDYATVARHYRPSHADLVAYHRFNGFNDPRGGGHFSARLTVAFVAAGVVAKKMLPPGIAFDTRLTEIGGCTDPARFDEVLRAAVKPTPSIGREQNTYNLATDKVEPLTIRGRHDVCVALRGAVVVEAAVAIALANLIRH